MQAEGAWKEGPAPQLSFLSPPQKTCVLAEMFVCVAISLLREFWELLGLWLPPLLTGLEPPPGA